MSEQPYAPPVPRTPTADELAAQGQRVVKRFTEAQRHQAKLRAKAARGGTKHATGATKALPSPQRRKKNKQRAASRRRNR